MVLLVSLAVAVHQNWIHLACGLLTSGTLLSHPGSSCTLFFVFSVSYTEVRGPVSVVGIATDYGLDGPGIESWWR